MHKISAEEHHRSSRRLALSLVCIGVATRLLPHWPDFTPIGASGLFCRSATLRMAGIRRSSVRDADERSDLRLFTRFSAVHAHDVLRLQQPAHQCSDRAGLARIREPLAYRAGSAIRQSAVLGDHKFCRVAIGQSFSAH
jgi:hypothetical protein